MAGRVGIGNVGKISAGKQKAVAAVAPTNAPQQPWTAPAPAYQAPVYQAPVYKAPVAYNPPAAPAPGIGGGGFAAPAPAPKPKLTEAEWLAGDSEFLDQDNEYNRALSEFAARIDKKKKNYEDDFNLGAKANSQNQERSLAGLGEDFAARGMAYSGVFDQARNDTEDNFKRQLANIETVKNRSVGQASDDLADYEQENKISRGNAKRNALARMANAQSLM